MKPELEERNEYDGYVMPDDVELTADNYNDYLEAKRRLQEVIERTAKGPRSKESWDSEI